MFPFRRRRRPAISHQCEVCQGTGRVAFKCECCGLPIAHDEALCPGCATPNPSEGGRTCYDIPYRREHYFSAAQLKRYDNLRAYIRSRANG